MNRAFIAAVRFGYGMGPGDVDSGGSEPRGWLKAQLARPEMPPGLASLPGSAPIVTKFLALRQAIKQSRHEEQAASPPTSDGAAEPKLPPELMGMRKELVEDFETEVGARVDAAVASRTPFYERLVAFWANHFTVSGVRPVVRPVAGAYEREAIRPYVTGRFEDMVLAVVSHPAMGLYLDNAVSIGPDSPAGYISGRGLNENLGRELLELHTLGVDGGYTEEDVRALARILTGWSIARPQEPDPGTFRFRPRVHEPGEKILLGRRFDQGGIEEGRAAIAMLCRHPSTARHVATKLARHFVADDPPPAAVERLADVFRDSDGDLARVSEAIVDSPEAWDRFGDKVKSPYDLVVSTARALGTPLPAKPALQSLRLLGQPLFMAPSPAGWPDDAASWVGPEAVMQRIDWLQTAAARLPDPGEPRLLAARVVGEAGSADLVDIMASAESREMALTLLFASPAFQRR